MKRYLVIAFYKYLGISKRITAYSNKNDVYEYIGGLRLCETPYIAFDTKRNEIFDINICDGYTKEEMINVLNEN